MCAIRRGRVGAVVAVLLGVLTAGASAGEVIGAKSSKVFHTYPDECSSAKKIKSENRVKFSSAGDAKKAGRRMCKRCADLDRRKAEEEAEPGPTGKPSGGESKDNRSVPGKRSATDAGAATESLPAIARVKRVLAGGTLELDVKEKVRLLGAVCPGAEQPCAEDAMRFIEEQTRGRRIKLSRDAHAGPTERRDALGRSLVYITPEPDGRDLGGELIFQGYAWLDRGVRSDRAAEYARHEEAAWRAGRGIWQALKGAAGKRDVVTGRHALHYHDRKCPHVPFMTGKVVLTINEARLRRLPPCGFSRDKRKEKDKGEPGRHPEPGGDKRPE